MQAEARALLVGVKLCVQRGFKQILVESDSMVLVRILNNEFQCPWLIGRKLEHIRMLSSDILKFQHSYREANKVADILAKEGCSKSKFETSVYER